METIKYYPPSTFKKVVPKGNGIFTQEVDFENEEELQLAVSKAQRSFNYEAPISFIDALKEGIQYGIQ